MKVDGGAIMIKTAGFPMMWLLNHDHYDHWSVTPLTTAGLL